MNHLSIFKHDQGICVRKVLLAKGFISELQIIRHPCKILLESRTQNLPGRPAEAQIWLVFIIWKWIRRKSSNLDDVHLGVLQELGEHGHGVVLDDGVCLGVGPGHDVAQAPVIGRERLRDLDTGL